MARATLCSLNALCRTVCLRSYTKDVHFREHHCPIHSLKVTEPPDITGRWKCFAIFHTAHCTGPTTSDGIWVGNQNVLWLCGFILTLIYC